MLKNIFILMVVWNIIVWWILLYEFYKNSILDSYMKWYENGVCTTFNKMYNMKECNISITYEGYEITKTNVKLIPKK